MTLSNPGECLLLIEEVLACTIQLCPKISGSFSCSFQPLDIALSDCRLCIVRGQFGFGLLQPEVLR